MSCDNQPDNRIDDFGKWQSQLRQLVEEVVERKMASQLDFSHQTEYVLEELNARKQQYDMILQQHHTLTTRVDELAKEITNHHQTMEEKMMSYQETIKSLSDSVFMAVGQLKAKMTKSINQSTSLANSKMEQLQSNIVQAVEQKLRLEQSNDEMTDRLQARILELEGRMKLLEQVFKAEQQNSIHALEAIMQATMNPASRTGQ